MDLKAICREVETISKEVGAFLLKERKHFDQNLVEEKSFNNLVSYVDKSAEQQFMNHLGKLLPNAGFIAEESEELKPDDCLNWVIDPLDGTTNFVFNLPFFCTSVALLKNDEILVAVIYDPTHDELFSAYKDGGAFLNGKAIQVSSKNKLIDSLIATGFPYDDFQFEAEYMLLLSSLMKKSKGVRRLGSAALDLAYVACGRFDVFYEYGLNSYDVAAGALIIKEAGGSVSDFNGGNNFIFGEEILSSNKRVHDETLSEIRKFFYK